MTEADMRSPPDSEATRFKPSRDLPTLASIVFKVGPVALQKSVTKQALRAVFS